MKIKNKKNYGVSYYSNFHESIVEPLAKLELNTKYDKKNFIGKKICEHYSLSIVHSSFTPASLHEQLAFICSFSTEIDDF